MGRAALQQLSTGGTVNAIFRIGGHLAARFPLRAEPVTQVKAWLTAEGAASAEFADVSTVLAPRPVAVGDPRGLFDAVGGADLGAGI